MSETTITSFVIRFKQEQAGSYAEAPWHGSIRYVQNREEIHFTDIKDALAFMAQFVELDQQKLTDQ